MIIFFSILGPINTLGSSDAYMYVSKLVRHTGADNGLSHVRRQALFEPMMGYCV